MNINPQDKETSDAQREDRKVTSEDFYMIGTDLMVYHDDNDITLQNQLVKKLWIFKVHAMFILNVIKFAKNVHPCRL
jgi:hypothetical protein